MSFRRSVRWASRARSGDTPGEYASGVRLKPMDQPKPLFPTLSIIDDGGPTTAVVAQPSGGNGAAHEERSNHDKVVIVGTGPAGLTAAIYAARANLDPIVMCGFTPGGLLMITSDVENYPGFPEGIQGPELMQKFREQAERFGSRVIDSDVDAVDFSSRPFRLWSQGTE